MPLKMPFEPGFPSRRMPSRRLLLVVLVNLLFAIPSMIHATTISVSATSFALESLDATLTIDDGIDPGNLVITLESDLGLNTGDLRGFHTHIADDILSTTFVLSHVTESLGLDLFSDQFFAVLAEPVGPTDSPRNTSWAMSKLKGQFPANVSEPNTSVLMALGLAGLALAGGPHDRPKSRR